MKSNYDIPKPTDRDYTDDEKELLKEIQRFSTERHRAEKALDNSYSHYRQVCNKYKNKPITPEPPFFVRGNTHPDPEEYRRLLHQAAKHREDTGQEEKIFHINLIDQRDMEAHRAHMINAQRVDMLRELIKKNDRLLKSKSIQKSDESDEFRKKKPAKKSAKRKPKKVVKKCKCN